VSMPHCSGSQGLPNARQAKCGQPHFAPLKKARPIMRIRQQSHLQSWILRGLLRTASANQQRIRLGTAADACETTQPRTEAIERKNACERRLEAQGSRPRPEASHKRKPPPHAGSL
jgi:hypothetical protein